MQCMHVEFLLSEDGQHKRLEMCFHLNTDDASAKKCMSNMYLSILHGNASLNCAVFVISNALNYYSWVNALF